MKKTVITFCLLIGTLAVFAAVNTKKEPCVRTAEGCWYCVFWNKRPVTVKVEPVGEDPRSNPALANAVARSNMELSRKIVTVGKWQSEAIATANQNITNATVEQPKVAVYGRTLCASYPWLPGCTDKVAMIHKRTSLSGEGEFIR